MDQSVLRVKWVDESSLRGTIISPDEPQRLDIELPACTIPLLVVKRAGTNNTVVMSNGAVDLARSEGRPVFQRATWWKNIKHNQIYVCDPATVGPNASKLAWGQIDEDYWFIPDASQVIVGLSHYMGSSNPAQRLYFGSSAGGFLSLALLSQDTGAAAIVNNSQFDWTRWMAPDVNMLRHQRFNSLLPTDIRRKFPQRTNVLNLLERVATSVKIDYWINMASVHDRTVSLPLMREFRLRFPNSHIFIHEYEDPKSGHNPLGPERTVQLINSHDFGPSAFSSTLAAL